MLYSFEMQNNTRVKVAAGPVAQFVWTRSDGSELSLSSNKRSLIWWNGGRVVKDYGTFTSAETMMNALVEFLHDPLED